MSDNEAEMYVQNASELGALMQEQHRARITAGQYPDGNPNAAMASQSSQANRNGEVETPMQMRAEIFRHEYDHPIIRQVMTVADVNGFSAEDRYTMLAFWLLKDNITMKERLMELARLQRPSLAIPKEMLYAKSDDGSTTPAAIRERVPPTD